LTITLGSGVTIGSGITFIDAPFTGYGGGGDVAHRAISPADVNSGNMLSHPQFHPPNLARA
jgi:hypothetical protein